MTELERGQVPGELSRRLSALDPARRAALEERLRRRAASRAGTPADPAVGPGAPSGGPVLTRRVGPGERAPLSFTQQRLWFLDQLDPGNPAYNVSWVTRCSGPLSRAGLAAAFTAVVTRHDTLRTTIHSLDGEPWQQAELDPAGITLAYDDLSGSAEPAATASRIAVDEARHRFDLAAGPLVRARLLRLSPDEHQLVLTMHHVVCDGWSLSVVLRDLAEAYQSAAAGRLPQLAPPPVSYADVAVWLRERLSGAERQRLLQYWRGALAGLPDRLDLPADRPRPTVSTMRGGRIAVEFDAELTSGLRELAQHHGATLFMALLAGLQALLARYTGQSDIPVGTPVSGRRHPDLENLVGLFLDTLVLRGDCAGDPTFAELLDRTRSTALDAYGHAELPFEVLVEELTNRRDLSRNPLFSVMLGLQNVPSRPGTAGSVRFEPLLVDPGVSKFDLNLSLEETPNGLYGVLHYATDLFDEERMVRLVGHYRTLLRAAVAAPDTLLSLLPLLTPAEVAELAGWQGPHRDYPPAPLPQLLAEQVARTPDAPAVWADGEQLSYAEFAAGVNRLARQLTAGGTGPDSVVGVCLPRSGALVTAVHAVLGAGGAYLPLPPDLPDARIAVMLADAGAGTVITTPELASRFTATGVRVVCPDTSAVAAQLATAPEVDLDLDALAYVIFTSGSTGRPKGVGVSHRAIVNRLCWMQEAFGLQADDRVLHKTPFSFDVSVWELCWPLLTGAGLVVAAEGAHRDPDELADLIAASRTTTAHFVPSMLDAFLDTVIDQPGSAGAARLASLRRVVCSGEALTPELAARFRSLLPAVELHNLYGPTEAAVDVSWHACRGDGGPVPIGAPVANTRLEIVDQYGNQVPVGVPGELCIGGVQLARGYVGRPDLTAERFVPEPGGGRRYRTGDLARWRADGEIEYLGRLDHQVKIHGFRIEPGEVEAVLAEQPELRTAVVLARDDRLVGYLVAATPQAATVDWAARLRRQLPDYLVPAAFVLLDTLPLTASGKLDRAALPDPLASVASTPGPATAQPDGPLTPAEETVAAVWREVLGLPAVGAHDNFFTVGGDSIRSLRVVARLRRAGYEVRLPQVFLHQTVRELAAVLTESAGRPAAADHGPGAAPIGPAAAAAVAATGALDGYPLTALQQGMLFHSELEAGAATYHDVLTVTLDRVPDSSALRAALHELTVRHAVLRTSFDLTGFDEPVQLVHPEVAVPLTEHDLSGLDSESAHQRLAEWRDTEIRTPFDWRVAPLLRAFLHRLPAGRSALTLSFHHAILDGWSVACLLTELLDRYHAQRAGTSLPVTPPAAAFREYVAAERDTVAAPESVRFWSERLAEAPASRLPRLRRPGAAPRPAGASTEQVAGVVDRQTAAELRAVAAQLGVPLRTVLLAAHLRVLALLTGEPDVVTGLVAHGRPESEAGAEVLGLFLNTLPLRADVDATSWTELIRQVFQLEVGALPHRRYPLFEIMRQTGRNTLFDAVFDYRDFHVYAGLADVPASERTSSEDPSADRLSIIGRTFFEEINFGFCAAFTQVPAGAEEAAGELALLITYHVAEFDHNQVATIHRRYQAALAAIAANPLADPRPTAPLLGADTVALREVNRTQVDFGPPTTLDDLVVAQVRRTPEAVAVIDGGTSVSYRELLDRADRLAARLTAIGVTAETVVGVHLPRSTDLVVAFLAVLRAGAAFLPLDVDYPVARLEHMLSDAGTAAMLTDSDHAGQLPFDGPTVLVGEPVPAGEPASVPPAGQRPLATHRLACVLYTSGSTGRPKGAMLEHAALVNYVRWTIADFGFTPADRVAQRAPIGFDAATGEIFSALATGAALVVVPSEVVADDVALAELLATQRVTYMMTVPSLLSVATEPGREPDPDGTARGLGRCVDLRIVASAGEPLSWQLAETVAAQAGARVVNVYGPSETAVVVSWWPAEVDLGGGPTVPIGRPVANTEFHVLDRWGSPQPIGAPGELFIGGAQLGRGYVNRPGATAERFVPDPFSGRPGARLYRTGDLVRWLPGGALEFLGRLDGQVKVRGVRIELGEVEAALSTHPAVGQAVVMVRTDLSAGASLVGYVTPAAAEPPGAAELRTHLRQRLPEAMVPSTIMVLDELPLLPNSKVNRAALPAPDATSGQPPYWPPRDAVEATVAQIWEELFGVDRVGVLDDFFDLGGHSLLALRLTARLRQEFGVDLPVASVLSAPTIGQLGELLSDARDGVKRGGVVPLQPHGDRPPLFVLHGLGGQVFRFLPMVRRLGRDQPVYGVTARGLTGQEQPHTSLDAMADDYAEQIRAIRPHGPYLMLGNCVGGNIGIEVARRLRAAGEEVPAVLMMWSHAVQPVVRTTLEDDAQLMMHALAGGPLQLDLDSLRGQDADEQLTAIIAAAADQNRLAPDTADLEQARRFLKVFRANAFAIGYHKHEPYDGTVVHLFPAEDPDYVPVYDYGWGEVVTGTLYRGTIPGTRDTTMYEPVVGQTATELRSWIDRVLARDADHQDRRV